MLNQRVTKTITPNDRASKSQKVDAPADQQTVQADQSDQSDQSAKNDDHTQYQLLKEQRLLKKQQLEQQKEQARQKERQQRLALAKEKEEARQKERATRLDQQKEKEAARKKERAERLKQKQEKEAQKKKEKEEKEAADAEFAANWQKMTKLQPCVMSYITFFLTSNLPREQFPKNADKVGEEYDRLRVAVGLEPVVAKYEQEYAKREKVRLAEQKKKEHEHQVEVAKRNGYDLNGKPLRPEDFLTNPVESKNLNDPDYSIGEPIHNPWDGKTYHTDRSRRTIIVAQYLAQVVTQEERISKWNKAHPDDKIVYDQQQIEKARAYFKQIFSIYSVGRDEYYEECDRWINQKIPFSQFSQFTYVKGYPNPALVKMRGPVRAAETEKEELSAENGTGSGMPKLPLDGMPAPQTREMVKNPDHFDHYYDNTPHLMKFPPETTYPKDAPFMKKIHAFAYVDPNEKSDDEQDQQDQSQAQTDADADRQSADAQETEHHD